MVDWPWLCYVTLPETNSSPLKIGHPKRKRSSSNRHVSGVKLVSGRVVHRSVGSRGQNHMDPTEVCFCRKWFYKKATWRQANPLLIWSKSIQDHLRACLKLNHATNIIIKTSSITNAVSNVRCFTFTFATFQVSHSTQWLRSCRASGTGTCCHLKQTAEIKILHEYPPSLTYPIPRHS